jgi:hypothetical protein
MGIELNNDVMMGSGEVVGGWGLVLVTWTIRKNIMNANWLNNANYSAIEGQYRPRAKKFSSTPFRNLAPLQLKCLPMHIGKFRQFNLTLKEKT